VDVAELFARVDRQTLVVTTIDDEADDRAFWLTRTPTERAQAVEFLRQMNYGYDPATTRLQRVLEVVELPWG
jgi:hypothetical protein